MATKLSSAERACAMLRFLRSLFAWRYIRSAGAWEYQVNTVTGRRAAMNSGGHSPLDWEWLLAGEGTPLINGVVAWRSAYRDTLPDGWYWA
jgi:hypothetical protein